jgi:hypothetical protein
MGKRVEQWQRRRCIQRCNKIEINPINSGEIVHDIRTPPIVHLGVYTDTCFILVRKTVVGFSHLEVSGDQPLLELRLHRQPKR